MNHVYRLVFNASLGAWVAAPDFARGTGKAAVRRRGAGAAWVKGLLALAVAFPVQAQQWTAATGDWFNAANWSAGVPTSASVALVINGGTAQVQAAGAAADTIFVYGDSTLEVTGAGRLTAPAGGVAGGGTPGTVRVTGGGQITGRDLWVDSAAASLLLVDGAGSRVSLASPILIGRTRNGTTILSNGGVLQSSRVYMGYVGGTGTLHIGNGSGAGIVDSSNVDTGSTGAGTINFNHTDLNYFFTRDGTGTGGAIAIAGNITVNAIGGGTTTLTGNNTYSRGTSIGTGTTLRVGNGGTIGTIGTGAITNDGTLAVDRANGFTLGQDISGAGRVVQAGAGTLALTGTNTYGGGTRIEDGQVDIANDQALGTGEVTMAGGGLLTTATMALANAVSFAPGTTSNITAAGGTMLWLTGPTDLDAGAVATFGTRGVDGAVWVNHVGLVDSAARVRVAGGTLRGSMLGFLTTGVQDVTVDDGATLETAGNSWVGIKELLGEGTVRNTDVHAVVAVGQGSFEGTIEGNITLRKEVGNASNILVLTGSNSYTGGTEVASGTLQVGDGGSTGTLGTGTVHLSGGALLDFNRTGTSTIADGIGAGFGGGHLRVRGGGTLVLTSTNNYTGTAIDASTLQIGASGMTGTLGTGTVTLTNDGRLDFNRDGTLAVANTITGTGSVRQLGPGTLELTGNNDYSGGTTIAGGTLSISADHNIGAASGALALHGGRLQTTGAFGMTRTVDLAGNGAFQVDGPTLTLGGTVGGSGNLVKDGVGTLILAADNSYAGTTTVFGGTLQVGNGGTTGSLGAGAVTNNGQLTFDRSDSFTVASAISGTGSLTHQGARTMTLTGNSTYAGTTTIAGGTLQVGNGTGVGTLGTGAVTNNGALVFNRNNTATVGNAISGTGTVTQAGTGVLLLTGANSHIGGTRVEAGTLQFGDAAALGTGEITLAGGKLAATADATLSQPHLVVETATTSTLAAATGTTLTIATGHISAGAGLAATNFHLGSATETGTIRFAGPPLAVTVNPNTRLFIDGGTVEAAAGDGRLSFLTDVARDTTVAAGATLDFSAASSAIVGDLQGAGVVVTAAAGPTPRLQVRQGNFSGQITGDGGLNKAGGGTLVLSGNNTYAGATEIDAGTLQVGVGTTTGNLGAGAVINNASLVFNRSDTATVGNAISGTGRVTHAGTGTLVLTGANSYTGPTEISAGTLQVGNGGATGTLGTGAVTNSGTLAFDRGDDLSFTGVISGSGDVVQRGDGMLTMAGSSSYTGGTTLASGGLRIGHDNALGTGALTIEAGTTLASDAARRITNDIVVNGDFDVFPGGTLPAVSSFALDGNMDLGGGNRTITNTMDSGSGQVGQLSIGGSISNGGLAFADAGFAPGGNLVHFRLDGGTANTYAGDTVVGTNVSLALGKAAGVTAVAGDARIRNEGELVIGNSEQIADTSTVRFEGRARMQVGSGAAVTETLAALQDDGTGLAEIALANAGGGSGLRVAAGNFSGAITGGAAGGTALEKTGAGTLVLSGNNTYLGDTLVSGGVLQVGNGGTSGTLGTGAVANDGTLAFHRSDAVVVANTITGAGGVRKLGTGTLELGGANSYSGGTAIDGGALSISADENIGAASGALALNGGTLRTTAAFGMARAVTLGGEGTFQVDGTALTLGGAVGGGGNLVKDGAGTLVLAADNNYAGTTTVSGGTLQVGDGGTTGSLGAGAVSNNGQLNFDRRDDFTVVNAIGGTGALTQQGAGTMTLTGSNSYAGGTTIAAGTLRVGDGGASGSLGTGAIANQGALVFDRAGVLAVDGAISGGGSLTQAGPGTTVLTGDNTYAGGTTIAAGTLQVGDGGASGTLGNGAVTNNGSLVFDRSGTLQVGAAISGSGTLRQQGVGTTVLTGANSYAGGTTISAGTLQVGDGGATGSLGTGNVTNDGALVFQRSDAVVAGGNIGGAGSLTQAGSGTLVLTGANSYTGGTTITDGTLQVGNGGTTGNLGSGAIANDGALVFGRSDTLAVAAAISGTGTLAQAGGGTLVLTGANSYTGGTTVADGTLQVGDGRTTGNLGSGAVVNGGALVFDRSDTLAVAAAISGAGTLAHAGDGTLVLTGANSYSGSTTIAAGTLQVGDGGASGTLGSGAIANQGALVFDRAGVLDVTGAISGSGTVTQAGPGTTVLAGANSYGGTTTITAGTLQVGNGGNSGSLGTGAVANGGTLAFDRSDAMTVANVIAGGGDVRQEGSGMTILAGDNSYTGTTTIAAGTLQVGNGGTAGSLGAGDVINDAALVFDRSDTVTLANAISGTGTLSQSGSGRLVLTGSSSYTGATVVESGTLAVNGSLASAVTVRDGGTLGGAGTIGGATVLGGGTLAPGNSIGTLTVDGDLRFAGGSTYRVEANAAGAADRVNSVGAGAITIDGGTVDMQASGAGYVRHTDYQILQADGGRTGTFDAVRTNLLFLTPTLVYQPDGVVLHVVANNAVDYRSAARSRNQKAVAAYLHGFADAPGSLEAASLIQQIDNLTEGQPEPAFDALSGSAHAAASQVAAAAGRTFSASLAARTDAAGRSAGTQYASLDPALQAPAGRGAVMAQDGGAGTEPGLIAPRRNLWAQALGGGGRIAGDGNGPRLRYDSSGMTVGYDQPLSDTWLAGAALGHARSTWDTRDAGNAGGRIGSTLAGLYARYAADNWQLDLDATYAVHRFRSDRAVAIGAAPVVTAGSSHDGAEWAVAAQVERVLQAGDWEVRPLAGVRHARLREDGFRESGAGSADLTVAARTLQNTVASAGVRVTRALPGGALELRAVGSHLFGDKDAPVAASLAGQPGSFTAQGTPIRRNALNLGARISGRFSERVSGYLDASYELRGAGQNAYQLTAGVRVGF